MNVPEEDVSLAKRILRDLKVIFDRESNLIEFDIIPVEDKIFNKSPVFVENQRLGLESWAIKHLFSYVYHQFMASRCHHVRTDNSSLHEWTRSLLLINPDLSTAWSCRKQLVLDEFISISDELKFSELLLKRRNKCPDNFAHRQWLIKMLNKTNLSLDENLVNTELELCYVAADRYQSNYYAWNHRRWIIQNFAYNLNSCICELKTSKSWIERHISDYSGFAYRQFLLLTINQLLKKSDVPNNSENGERNFWSFLADEMDMVNDLLQIHHNRESLHLHRRFIVKLMVTCFPENESDCLETEKEFVQKESTKDKALVDRHTLWCLRVFNWDLN